MPVSGSRFTVDAGLLLDAIRMISSSLHDLPTSLECSLTKAI